MSNEKNSRRISSNRRLLLAAFAKQIAEDERGSMPREYSFIQIQITRRAEPFPNEGSEYIRLLILPNRLQAPLPFLRSASTRGLLFCASG